MFNFFKSKAKKAGDKLIKSAHAQIDAAGERPEPEPTKPEPEPTKPEPETIAELNFTVDVLGDIWVECKWDASIRGDAHMFFADMLNKVSSGETLDDSLMAVREVAEEEGRLEEYQAILNYMLKCHEEKMALMFSDMMTNMTAANTQKEDSLVVNPTDILSKGHSHDQ